VVGSSRKISRGRPIRVIARSTPSRTTFSPYTLRGPVAETAVRAACLVGAFMPPMLEPCPWVKVEPLIG
jgi:hypothetical protein